MPKLPSLKPREVVKKLKRLGFEEHHQVGSHLTMKHPVTDHRAVIPMHLKDIKKGTLSSMLREAGIEKDEFIET
ncbi:MAG: type II toxin-antitoxin system HicA family toxin [Candidatus Gottesmanbacteria bacterium]|nr:type II toxin-antitoxin system HicA family toxin [Candidatus Gottesmanbacteria bacterium]